MDSNSKIEALEQLKNIRVIKRTGGFVCFDSQRIFNAIHKAFKVHGHHGEVGQYEEVIQGITDSVVVALVQAGKAQEFLYIENIQDAVQEQLIKAGEIDVARGYKEYREERNKNRLQDTIDVSRNKGVEPSMHVIKRNGEKEPVSLDKITQRIGLLSKDLKIDTIMIAQKAVMGLYDGITTNEIDNYLAETAAALTIEHPDYSKIAARIKANALHKETGGFAQATAQLYADGLLDEAYYKKAVENMSAIEKIIQYDRDYDFDYFALTTLLKACLLYTSPSPRDS